MYNFSGYKLTPDDVREILRYVPVPVQGTGSRVWWMKIISATCSALDGDESTALSLLEEWSPPWKKNDYENVLRSFRGEYRCSAGTLILFAKDGGFDASAFYKKRLIETHLNKSKLGKK